MGITDILGRLSDDRVHVDVKDSNLATLVPSVSEDIQFDFFSEQSQALPIKPASADEESTGVTRNDVGVGTPEKQLIPSSISPRPGGGAT
ncbi:hypothetical protein HYFRA_00006071 [Hymenoscyphus fraxineus]|uniref:Uncharacterized protein n=1 Tax=Hymenoscyphus fraxineus TaxID=746836 RepID=A0A9N9PTE7_9HELO|nr:hypothetical protein HYFRA_00006071 [Hymenoscyphus fraxineus]